MASQRSTTATTTTTTNGSARPPTSLPPKVPFTSSSSRSLHDHLAKTKPPQRVQSTGSAASATGSSSMSIASDSSRDGLRREVLRRKNSLTASEFNFLQGIVANGTEVEVQLVQQKLCDPSLCFDVNSGEDDDEDDHCADSRDRSDSRVSTLSAGSGGILRQKPYVPPSPLPMVVQLLNPSMSMDGEMDASIDTCATGQGKPPSTPMPLSPRRDVRALEVPSVEELYPDHRHNHNVNIGSMMPHIPFSDLEKTPLVQNLRNPKSLEGAVELPFLMPRDLNGTASENITPRVGNHQNGHTTMERPPILRRRTSNPLVDQLWRAHEQGLAVTQKQSHNHISFLRREHTLSAMSPGRRCSGASRNSSINSLRSNISSSSTQTDHSRSLLNPQELLRIKQRHFRTKSQSNINASEVWLQRPLGPDKQHQHWAKIFQLKQNTSNDSSTTDYTNNTIDITSLLLPTDEEIFRRTVQLQQAASHNNSNKQQQEQGLGEGIPDRPPAPRPFGFPAAPAIAASVAAAVVAKETQVAPKATSKATLRRMSSDGVAAAAHLHTRRTSTSILRRMTSDGASRSKSVSFQINNDDPPCRPSSTEPPAAAAAAATAEAAAATAAAAVKTTSSIDPSQTMDSLLYSSSLPMSASADTMDESLATFSSDHHPSHEIIREKSVEDNSNTPKADIAWGRRDSSNSVASFSLHRAHPVRQESICSTAEGWLASHTFQEELKTKDSNEEPGMASLNLHRARPVRQDSIGSTVEGAEALRAFRMNLGAATAENAEYSGWARRDSMNSIASLNLHRAHPIRQESMASATDGSNVLEAFQNQFSSDGLGEYRDYPWDRRDSLASLNLHLAAPLQESIFLRRESMNSVCGGADLDAAEAFRLTGWSRRDSMNSIASLNLHRAHPIRQDSIASSVGWGRRDSTNSIASMNLHLAHPIRQDSNVYTWQELDSLGALSPRSSGRVDSMSSLASLNLHKARPVRQDSIVSNGDGLEATEAIRREFAVQRNTVLNSYGRQESMASVASLNLHPAHPVIDADNIALDILRNRGSAFSEQDVDEESMPRIPPGQPFGQEHVPSTSTGSDAKEEMQKKFQVITGQSFREASSGTALSSASEIPSIEKDTIMSFPSLHPATPLRQDSIASTAAGKEAKENWRKLLGQASVVASEWEGIVSPDEWEDKKVEDENVNFRSEMSDTRSMVITRHDRPRPVIMRHASASEYDEEGMEVAAVEEEEIEMFTTSTIPQLKLKTQIIVHEGDISTQVHTEDEHEPVPSHVDYKRPPETEERQNGYRHFPNSLVSFGGDSIKSGAGFSDGRMKRRSSIEVTASFDESKSIDRFRGVFRGPIPRSISEDELSALLAAHCKPRPLSRGQSDATVYPSELNSESWEMDTLVGEYDAWDAIRDDYANGYGGGGTLPFRILGTNARDTDSQPHVLSPPLMESLQSFLPTQKSNDNFWMKYSLVRDGASLHTFMQHARGAKYSILALETTDGEVFGAFTTEPWRKTWSYFGGEESFLWRMRHSRKTQCHSILDQAQMESEIDVYPFTGVNQCTQLCTHNTIAVGGGSLEHPVDEEKRDDTDDRQESVDVSGIDEIKDHEWGSGLAVQGDLQYGSSSPCVTFGSPSLSKTHSDGSMFEIVNLELWTLTPCSNVMDAEKLELGKLFLEQSSFNFHDMLE